MADAATCVQVAHLLDYKLREIEANNMMGFWIVIKEGDEKTRSPPPSLIRCDMCLSHTNETVFRPLSVSSFNLIN